MATATTPGETLSAVLIGVSSSTGAPLVRDAQADAAAAVIARSNLDGTASPLASRQALWGAGLRDVQFTPVSLIADELPPTAALAVVVSAAEVDWGRTNVGGAGIARQGGKVAVTFLLVQRAAAFEGPNVLLPADSLSARVIVTTPLGHVGARELAPVPARAGLFVRDEEIQRVAGTWVFELERDTERGRELMALWTVNGESVPASARDGGDTLGLGPHGLGTTEEGLTAADGLAWVIGAGDPPGRAPVTRDAEEVEKHLRQLTLTRRRAVNEERFEMHVGATRVARTRSAAELAGTGEDRSPHARLLESGVTPLAATEVVIEARDPMQAWANLLAEPAARQLILTPGISQLGLGASIGATGTHWSVAVTLIRAEIGGADATWRSVVREHLRRARSSAGLGELYARGQLDTLAEEAAREVSASGLAQMSTERRAALVQRTREIVPDSSSVGIDVLVTRDPGAVTSRKHVTEARFAEVGVGIVEVPDSDAGFAVVLVLVQR